MISGVGSILRILGGSYGFFISAPQQQIGIENPSVDSLSTRTSALQAGF